MFKSISEYFFPFIKSKNGYIVKNNSNSETSAKILEILDKKLESLIKRLGRNNIDKKYELQESIDFSSNVINKKVIHLCVRSNENMGFYNENVLFGVLLYMYSCIQNESPCHNQEFYKILSYYQNSAIDFGMLKIVPKVIYCNMETKFTRL
jgi:hypothetical protein